MNVKPCQAYHSATVGRQRLDMPDGHSVFKLYLLSLFKRADPERYEWDRSAATPGILADSLRRLAPEGVGFITAFPHITKIFRFAPAAETVLHVRALRTSDLAPLDLARDDNQVEFACYAEAAIAADEYRLWAGAATVADYLRVFSDFDKGSVVNHAKLGEYYEAKQQGRSGR